MLNMFQAHLIVRFVFFEEGDERTNAAESEETRSNDV